MMHHRCNFKLQKKSLCNILRTAKPSISFLAAIQPDEFVLGSLWFLDPDVDLGLLSFIWGPEWDVKGLDGQIIIPSSEVPEPATLFLLGSGLLGFGLTRRRARS